MTHSPAQEFRPGQPVECLDGPCGTVAAVEPGEDETQRTFTVRTDEASPPIRVPIGLVERIEPDGTVHLSCRRSELGRDESVRRTSVNARAVADRTEHRTLDLKEEELRAHKAWQDAGSVLIRKEVDQVPRRLEVEAFSEQVTVEHVPVDKVVREQVAPWEEDGDLVVPVYEEQLVLVKRLVMKEQLRIRREASRETRLFEETVRRERVVVEDPDRTGRVRELHPSDEESPEEAVNEEPDGSENTGFLERLGRKVLE